MEGLLLKGTIKFVPPSWHGQGYYSGYFLACFCLLCFILLPKLDLALFHKNGIFHPNLSFFISAITCFQLKVLCCNLPREPLQDDFSGSWISNIGLVAEQPVIITLFVISVE